MEQTAPMEETAERPEQPGASEGEPRNKYSLTKIFSLQMQRKQLTVTGILLLGGTLEM